MREKERERKKRDKEKNKDSFVRGNELEKKSYKIALPRCHANRFERFFLLLTISDEVKKYKSTKVELLYLIYAVKIKNISNKRGLKNILDQFPDILKL